MAESLPPFLFPLATEDAQDIPCQNAQFIHGQSLGSSHALWWAPHSPDQEVDQVLLFIPGALHWALAHILWGSCFEQETPD